MSGWIKIHRRLKDNIIWQRDDYLKGWLTILFEVNHEPQDVLIGSQKIPCDRGEKLYSLQTWRDKLGFGWSLQKVRTFFSLLESENMIKIEGLHKTTRLSVCNYSTYQDEQHANNTPTTRQQQQYKNDKNEKNKHIDEIYQSYPSKDPVTNRSTGKCSKDKNKIKNLLKTMEKEELLFRINNYLENCKLSKAYIKNFQTFLNNIPEPIKNSTEKKRRILQ